MSGRARRETLEVRVEQRELRRVRLAAERDGRASVLGVEPVRRSSRVRIAIGLRHAALRSVMDAIMGEVDTVEFGPVT
jgi:hypothetical protein